MAREIQDAAHLTDYLLGKLSESESEKVEREYFGNEDAFERMLIAEDDLIDDYVSNRLSADDRLRVQRALVASPEGRERIQFARSLADAINDARVTTKPPERQPQRHDQPARSSFAFLWSYLTPPRAALTAAALVVVAAFVFLLVERARMRTELAELREERTMLDHRARVAEQAAAMARQEQSTQSPENPTEAAQVPPKSTEGEKQENEQPRSEDLIVELHPGLVRSGGLTSVQVSRNTKVVFLKLNLDSEPSHDTYSFVVETAGGRQVSRNDAFKRDPKARGALRVPLSAKLLVPGDYVLILRGKTSDGDFEGVANYSFRVVRK